MKTNCCVLPIAQVAFVVALPLWGCGSDAVDGTGINGSDSMDTPQSSDTEKDSQLDGTTQESKDSDSSTVSETTLTYPIVDTKQKKCYDANGSTITCPASNKSTFGQDAQYAGFQPSYTDNGDGTITDNITGLMWQQDPGSKMSFDDAVAGASSFALAGYDDWRLPTIKELYSLILFSGRDPSGLSDTSDTSGLTPFIDDSLFVFQYGDVTGERIIDSQYVSATEYVHTTMKGDDTVFGVNFADGRIKGYGKGLFGQDKLFYVSYVRGNPNYGINDFTDNNDETISDAATGLMWMKNDNGEGVDWEAALSYCEGLDLAGYDDWRLPDVKELQSIVDYSRSPDTTNSAAIDPIFNVSQITNEADQKDYPFYWSGTTHANMKSGQYSAYVSFGRSLGYMNNSWMDVHGAGSQRSDPKTGDPADFPATHGPQGDVLRVFNHVRCVRGDNVTLAHDTEEPGNDTGAGDTDGPGDPGNGNTGTQEPAPCTRESDCDEPSACPEDAALGCTCTQTMEGTNGCIPQCAADDDCPTLNETSMICESAMGLCIPSSDGPGGPSM